MILLAAEAMAALVAACEAAYPEEACGLLVGRRRADGRVEVARAVPSANLADEPRRRFEVDPALRLRLQREARRGRREIVGHFHSHPDGAPVPSETDLAEAWEPELVWLIAAVAAGRVAELRAHAIDPASGRFRQLPLRPAAPAGKLAGAGREGEA